MLSGRDRHAAQRIVYPKIAGLFAIDKGVPAFAIVDLAKDRKLVGLRRKIIIDLVEIVLDELDGRAAVRHRGEWYLRSELLLDDDGIAYVDAVEGFHFLFAVPDIVDGFDQPDRTEGRR